MNHNQMMCTWHDLFPEECPPGTMEKRGLCIPCKPNTFQPQGGQTDCIPCPDGRKTFGISARHEADCHGMFFLFVY